MSNTRYTDRYVVYKENGLEKEYYTSPYLFNIPMFSPDINNAFHFISFDHAKDITRRYGGSVKMIQAPYSTYSKNEMLDDIEM